MTCIGSFTLPHSPKESQHVSHVVNLLLIPGETEGIRMVEVGQGQSENKERDILETLWG